MGIINYENRLFRLVLCKYYKIRILIVGDVWEIG